MDDHGRTERTRKEMTSESKTESRVAGKPNWAKSLIFAGFFLLSIGLLIAIVGVPALGLGLILMSVQCWIAAAIARPLEAIYDVLRTRA
ncbi:hypothetical protein [Brevibacterium otitidis]|uniref:Transmembrane protein (PGPGW) n=1 Tax=Brevibacterium otitidis TaxID=53364 RepID=A0ABV5X0Y0_9MICO|nr:hypothetical protein GCM10023233_05000 [Brevibacterium otitidis]